MVNEKAINEVKKMFTGLGCEAKIFTSAPKYLEIENQYGDLMCDILVGAPKIRLSPRELKFYGKQLIELGKSLE